MKNKYRKLDKIYGKIPEIDCKGLCHHSCTLIPVAKAESQRARDRLGCSPYKPTADEIQRAIDNKSVPTCRALKDMKCSIYTIRPAICRLYGVAEGLECQFGCKPKATLTKEEAYNLIRETEAI
jgi:Fe-S-cluster containining protein